MFTLICVSFCIGCYLAISVLPLASITTLMMSFLGAALLPLLFLESLLPETEAISEFEASILDQIAGL